MLVLCVLLLMGCVSDQNSYNANLQNWVGMSQETLYESWGTPTNELYVGPNEKVHLSKREVGSTLTDTAPVIADGTYRNNKNYSPYFRSLRPVVFS